MPFEPLYLSIDEKRKPQPLTELTGNWFTDVTAAEAAVRDLTSQCFTSGQVIIWNAETRHVDWEHTLSDHDK